jgi:hypothetical protein
MRDVDIKQEGHTQSMDIAAMLRALPHSLRTSPEVAYALRTRLAVSNWDPMAFLRCHAQGTWLQKALMAPKLQEV